ncbi:hypothetical protein L0337_04040 [candidate division KSB1 bacterium]|nr:hypothetical protein [candidate division KSB1 bacterium]
MIESYVFFKFDQDTAGEPFLLESDKNGIDSAAERIVNVVRLCVCSREDKQGGEK